MVVGKYDALKYWVRVKARAPHRCQACGVGIGKGEFYYRERIDFVRPPPGLVLGELCEKCGGELRDVGQGR